MIYLQAGIRAGEEAQVPTQRKGKIMNTAKTLDRMDFSEKTVGQIVAEDFRTAEVFNKYGIDFCCGGSVPLSEACREKGADPAAVVRELEAAKSSLVGRELNYGQWELPFLADYIVNTHHAYLRENTGQIAAYVRKIAEVHGTRHPEVVEIADIFDRVAADMEGHLEEEEEILFPAIRRIAAARKAGPPAEPEDLERIRDSLAQLDREHQEIGDAVHVIRDLSKGYVVPGDACNTYLVTYRKLREFEDDLHKHVHLENNILFPRATKL
jgi:regulator of cell morphogenesis and NO signaling